MQADLKVINYKDKLKNSRWINGFTLYLAGVLSLAVLAYGCKFLLSFL